MWQQVLLVQPVQVLLWRLVQVQVLLLWLLVQVLLVLQVHLPVCPHRSANQLLLKLGLVVLFLKPHKLLDLPSLRLS
jgi:hypothetical protein